MEDDLETSPEERNECDTRTSHAVTLRDFTKVYKHM